MAALSLPFKPFGWFRRARPTPPRVLFPAYRHDSALRRNRKKLALALFLFVLIYTMAFQLFGRFYAAPFLFPLGVLALLIVWALPDTVSPPLRGVQFFFSAFLVALLIWPDYLALSLPGLPWITAVRLTGGPMILLLLISLSVSMAYRKQMQDLLAPSRPLVKLVIAFAGVMCFSLFVSDGIVTTSNKLVVGLINLIGAFFISAYVFAQPGKATRFVFLMWGATILLCFVALWEAKLGRLPWAGHVPSWLAVEDPAIQKRLSGLAGGRKFGAYRVVSRFNTPLSFAEFLALVTPFILHIALTASRLWLRPLAMISLPLIFYVIVKTDSRLGMAGFFMAFVLYILAWSGFTWYRRKSSIFGPALTLAYPVIFASFIVMTFVYRPLQLKVWGGGAHRASNAAREAQWEQGLPLIAKRPWGYGMGEGGEALGFRGPSGLLTVDSYYLTALLDLGIAGLAVFLALFITGILTISKRFVMAKTFEETLLGPIAISLVIFLITKSVLSQQENHSLMFIILGMGCALIWRVHATDGRSAKSLW